ETIVTKLDDFFRESPDNYFYDLANEWEKESIRDSDNGKYLQSWAVSTSARLPYLADAVVTVAAAPLAFIGMIFGLVPAIFTWGKETSLLSYSSNKFIEKINHLCISLLGAFISPWLAHQGKDANVAAGALVALALVGGEICNRTVFAINVN
ncbi:MAG: hypothetical protein ACE5GN_05155, partial [Waddliaceae bacterium]